MTITERRPDRDTFRRFFAELGPGLITGAADDDPSGISTYSVAGAAFGYLPLWTAVFSFPLMAAVQLMCARLGLVTGRGLAAVIRLHYPRWVLWGACTLLLTANVINIAADLSGMGAATAFVTGIPSGVWVPIFTASIVGALFWSSYRSIARVFKWLTLVLGAYIAAAFVVHVDWLSALKVTTVPRVVVSRDFFAVLTAILGTTISPYLFFWQAAQEVEEERSRGRKLGTRLGSTHGKLRVCRTDVVTGMFASNLTMYFIILTTAATLHAHGHRVISTAEEAAEALRPLAGAGASWLFALGLIGTGMLAVPVLAGSCPYAVSEAADWRGSLARKPDRAKKFYGVIAVAMVIGLALGYAGFNAIRLLFVSAVINGVLAPPLVLLVILSTRNRQIMGTAVNPPLLELLGWSTLVVMTVAALGLLV